MKNKIIALFETFMYYIIYLFSGIIGNIAAVAVSTVVIGFEYISNHMSAKNAEFFNEVMNLVQSELALGILLANMSVLLIYWLAFRSKRIKLSTYTGMRRFNLLSVVAALVAGFVAHGLVLVVLENLKPVAEVITEYEHKMEWMREGNVFLLLVVTLIVAPIVEEIVFRGVLITSLQKIITPIGALILTSVLFGVAHGNIVQGIYSFLLGLILGFIRIRSGSLLNCIFMHISFNASNIIAAVSGVSVTGLPIWAIVLILCVLLLFTSRPVRDGE